MNSKRFMVIFFVILLVAILSSSALILLICNPEYIGIITGQKYIYMPGFVDATSNELHNLNLEALLNEGVITSYDQLVGAISGFYSTVIVILITVVSILGVFAYFSIYTLSRRDAERIVDESVKEHLEKKLSQEDYVSDLLQRSDAIRNLTEAYIKNELEPRLEDLKSRVMGVEYWAMANSSSSERKGEGGE